MRKYDGCSSQVQGGGKVAVPTRQGPSIEDRLFGEMLRLAQGAMTFSRESREWLAGRVL